MLSFGQKCLKTVNYIQRTTLSFGLLTCAANCQASLLQTATCKQLVRAKARDGPEKSRRFLPCTLQLPFLATQNE